MISGFTITVSCWPVRTRRWLRIFRSPYPIGFQICTRRWALGVWINPHQPTRQGR